MTEPTVGVITTVVGDYAVNCYIAYSPIDKVGVIIDPGDDAKRVQAKAEKSGIDIKYVINTHCHADHVGAVAELVKTNNAEYGRSAKETELINASYTHDMLTFLGLEGPPGPDFLLKEDEIFTVSPNLAMKVIETPGHTPGGLCFLFNEEVLFTGDSLFRMSIGRTDFPLSNHDDLMNSLLKKIVPLPDDIIVYPGHEAESTIGFEKLHNPFLTGRINS